ncbi:MAG: hypothetical protein AB7S80_08200 [Rhizobiaceae bacterium]
MNRFLKKTVLSCTVAAMAITAIPAANAGGRFDRNHEVARHSDNSDDVIAAGILGLAVGAIIVAAISTPEPRGLLDRDPENDRSVEDALGYFPPAPKATSAELAMMDFTAEEDDGYFRKPTRPSTWDVNDRSFYKYCEDNYRWGKARGVKKFSCSAE